ncbi:MAG: HAMP domain-containing protein, partial [Burkholderiaceae bacterium]|nr:HAMP domain-containing protein [Burkholderiaceae bacterium]
SVFVAVAFAFDIASRLTRPLHLLALGTKAIAEGNLSPQSATPSSADELGSLIQSFNSMTRQLSIAQQQTEESQSALESAKAYLELVLAHMSAGVIVLDADFKLVSCNEAVSRILRQDISVYVGDMLSQVGGIGSFLASITAAFSDMKAHTAAEGIGAEKHYWQKQIEIAVETSQSSQDITLLVRGSYLPVKGETGYIVVFDDVTEIVSAQRATAWGEVARRLAHEIKNPLTPIQLSAERIPLKLREKLDEPDRQFLDRSTQTIINQVTAMKCMVDDFRDYARAPQATLTPLEINSLVEDVVHLYAGNDMQDAITLHLTDVLPRIMGDATQLRQVIHNLLQNALDATDEILADTRPQIVIRTEKITYQDVVNTPCIAVRLSVTDNGPGFPQKILAQIFEPYSTTKERGTGLGLAVVKKIVDEHHGRIDVQNRIGTHGAAVSVLFLRLADEA